MPHVTPSTAVSTFPTVSSTVTLAAAQRTTPQSISNQCLPFATGLSSSSVATQTITSRPIVRTLTDSTATGYLVDAAACHLRGLRQWLSGPPTHDADPRRQLTPAAVRVIQDLMADLAVVGACYTTPDRSQIHWGAMDGGGFRWALDSALEILRPPHSDALSEGEGSSDDDEDVALDMEAEYGAPRPELLRLWTAARAPEVWAYDDRPDIAALPPPLNTAIAPVTWQRVTAPPLPGESMPLCTRAAVKAAHVLAARIGERTLPTGGWLNLYCSSGAGAGMKEHVERITAGVNVPVQVHITPSGPSTPTESAQFVRSHSDGHWYHRDTGQPMAYYAVRRQTQPWIDALADVLTDLPLPHSPP